MEQQERPAPTGAYSGVETYNSDEPSSIVPDTASRMTASGRRRTVQCRECVYWFLGCLRGRARWHDQAITPNFRHSMDALGAPRIRCDAFTWDPDEERQGRCVTP